MDSGFQQRVQLGTKGSQGQGLGLVAPMLRKFLWQAPVDLGAGAGLIDLDFGWKLRLRSIGVDTA